MALPVTELSQRIVSAKVELHHPRLVFWLGMLGSIYFVIKIGPLEFTTPTVIDSHWMDFAIRHLVQFRKKNGLPD